jgi:hypothetical protein
LFQLHPSMNLFKFHALLKIKLQCLDMGYIVGFIYLVWDKFWLFLIPCFLTIVVMSM